jgi:hypothetical protein
MPKNSLVRTTGLKRRAVLIQSAIVLAIVLPLWHLTRAKAVATPGPSTEVRRTYTTSFPLTEDPISENGKWTSGKSAGLDWANIRTTPGFAFGTQSGGRRGAPEEYDNSTALLAGSWGPEQVAQAMVHSVNQNDKIYEEVELRLRSALSPHRCTGYEICFRCSKTPKAYCSIVRWNGPLGSFTYLKQGVGAHYGVANGDVVKATIVGRMITAYINGVQVLQASDPTYSSGSPGIGFYIEVGRGVDHDYGFKSFTATAAQPLM